MFMDEQPRGMTYTGMADHSNFLTVSLVDIEKHFPVVGPEDASYYLFLEGAENPDLQEIVKVVSAVALGENGPYEFELVRGQLGTEAINWPPFIYVFMIHEIEEEDTVSPPAVRPESGQILPDIVTPCEKYLNLQDKNN